MRTLLPHHQATLDAAVEALKVRPEVMAVLLAGSIAKGMEKPTSDVDLLILVEEPEFERRRASRDMMFVDTGLATYEGGYVDAKYISPWFLEAAAKRGSEPTRDMFTGVTPAWTRVEGLEPLLAAIPRYPEYERADKIRSFYSQMLLQRFFLSEADKREDPYLAVHAATQTVLFASRLILAHNRILFPSNKRLLERVEIAPEKPEGFLDHARQAAANPGEATGIPLIDLVQNWRDWGIDWATALGQFSEDAEFNWFDHRPPVADW